MVPVISSRTLAFHGRQRGGTTLFVVVTLLVMLTIIVLASTNIALFEQKTANNANRQILARQAAEYALNLGGEYLKANVVNIASNEDDNGWLKAGGPNLHWQPCEKEPDDANHPCMAEVDEGRRSQLYYYTTDGAAVTDAASVKLDVPYASLVPAAVNQTTVGGSAEFPVTAKVRALLCRIDTSPGSTPSCQINPAVGNRIAITMIAESRMADENASAQVKETWGTYSNFSAQSSVPLVASGVVKGLGNASIVAAANAGGYGLPGSIWSSNSVDIDGFSTAGLGSATTCHLGDYLGSVPVAELQTTCAGSGATGCGCANVAAGSPDMLSGKFGGITKQESIDVLDVDGGHGGPDIQFFPGKNILGTCMDKATDATDDNLFEWIFGQDTNGASTCATAPDPAKEVTVLTDLGAQTVATCDGLSTTSSGLYYVTGACDLKADIGSPGDPVVVVVNGDVGVSGSKNFFGMLFVRDVGAGASLKGAGSPKVFGSVVVDGEVDVTGGLNIIYIERSAGDPGKKLPPTTRFGRAPGSWLDSMSGI